MDTTDCREFACSLFETGVRAADPPDAVESVTFGSKR